MTVYCTKPTRNMKSGDITTKMPKKTGIKRVAAGTHSYFVNCHLSIVSCQLSLNQTSSA